MATADHQQSDAGAGPRASKVALWCAPRSTSTVFTRCLSGIPGIEVYLELYSNAKSFRGNFFKATGKELPMEVEEDEAMYGEANATWEKMGIQLDQKFISYPRIKKELENTGNNHILIKEMAINSIDPKYMPSGFKHVFLIRDPSRVFDSARKIMGRKFVNVGMIPSEENYDIVRDDPLDTQPMKWFEKQHALLKYVKEHIDPNPVVIDWSDLLSNSAAIVRVLCDAVGFPYSDELLRWESVTDQPHNYVTAGEKVFEEMFMFYERAFKSTHFSPPKNVGPIPRDQLTDDVIRCVDYSMPFYNEMFAQRLRAP